MNTSLAIPDRWPGWKKSGRLLRMAIALLVVAFGCGLLAPAAAREDDGAPVKPPSMLNVTVEQGVLPGAEGFVVFGHVTLGPGARQTLPERGERGTIVIVVESGTLTYRIEGDGRVIRNAGNGNPHEEAAPSAAPFTLAAGDALVYPAQARVEANDGAEPAVFLYAVILEPIGPPDPNPADAGEITGERLGFAEGNWPELVSGPVMITLSRTHLESGEVLPGLSGGIQIVGMEPGSQGLLIPAGGGWRNYDDVPTEIFVLTIVPANPAAESAA
jgi:hypothetical protein